MEYKADQADTVLISPEHAQYLHQPTSTNSRRRILIYAVLITVACIIAGVVVAVVTVFAREKPSHASSPKTTPFAHLQPAHANVDGLGELRGYASKLKGASQVAVFLGIPYGKAPVKERRWRTSEPFGSWSNKIGKARDATRPGAACFQDVQPGAAYKLTLSEDCLFLNVATPVRMDGRKVPTKNLLPVMVWIHGGAFTHGSGTDPTHRIDSLVAHSLTTSPVVVVSLNYRLGVFGFLAGDEMKQRCDGSGNGNFGIQDQRLALKWVRDHIVAFGGDKNLVTIFGDTAGGNSVLNHVALSQSSGLFSHAIIQSGAFDTGAMSMELAQRAYDRIKSALQCDNLECLLAATPEELLQGMRDLKDNALFWGPVVDGYEVTAPPTQLIARGQHNKVPIIVGSTRDGASYFRAPKFHASKVWLHVLEPLVMPDTNYTALDQLYSPDNYEYPKNKGGISIYWWRLMRELTDRVPGLGPCSVRWFANLLKQGGTPSVYVYFLTHPAQSDLGNLTEYFDVSGPGNVLVPKGAAVLYAFNDIQLLSGEDAALADTISQYWISFAATGHPQGEVTWPQYDRASRLMLQLDAPSGGGVRSRSDIRKRQCDFWKQQNDMMLHS